MGNGTQFSIGRRGPLLLGPGVLVEEIERQDVELINFEYRRGRGGGIVYCRLQIVD